MQHNFIVIGSGLAGLSFALKAAQLGSVLVLSKDKLIQANTWRAQGGVAAVTSASDSFEKHIEDTLVAGDGLCEQASVRQIIEQGPMLMNELKDLGIHFDSVNNEIDLGKEGGHSQRRILHIDDFTGQALHSRFIELCQNHPNIKLLEHTYATELIKQNDTCVGLKAFDENHSYEFYAPYVIIAAGGTGKAFLYTSNWSGATGDGLCLAYNIGAELSNLEFTQFHPTCLYHPAARNFLISEALRGEGGKLLNSKGEYFMTKYHPLADLAPRDIVSRAIDQEMKISGSECVWLDLAYMKNPEHKKRFPKIYERCLELGIDFLKTPIPVVPAAHYMCGGITVNQNSETTIKNLFALGECAETGLHGANRLASNSLLECLATAENAFQKIRSEKNKFIEQPLEKSNVMFMNKKEPALSVILDRHDVSAAIDRKTSKPETRFHLTTLWKELRRMMWNRMGIVRSNTLIDGALKKMEFFEHEIELIKKNDPDVVYDHEFTELLNICLISKLMILSAAGREESRGCHYNTNYPERAKNAKKSRCRIGHNVEYIST